MHEGRRHVWGGQRRCASISIEPQRGAPLPPLGSTLDKERTCKPVGKGVRGRALSRDRCNAFTHPTSPKSTLRVHLDHHAFRKNFLDLGMAMRDALLV